METILCQIFLHLWTRIWFSCFCPWNLELGEANHFKGQSDYHYGENLNKTFQNEWDNFCDRVKDFFDNNKCWPASFAEKECAYEENGAKNKETDTKKRSADKSVF